MHSDNLQAGALQTQTDTTAIGTFFAPNFVDAGSEIAGSLKLCLMDIYSSWIISLLNE